MPSWKYSAKTQFRKVFWTVFVALAGLVLALIVDPATVRVVIALLTGCG